MRGRMSEPKGVKLCRSKALQRLEACYPVLVRIFAQGRRSEFRGLAAIAKVVCSILSSRRCTSRLAATRKPFPYLHQAVRNALRHRPPKKELLLERWEPIQADGTTLSGYAPRAPLREPWEEAARAEGSVLLGRLLARLPQPKRGMVVLKMRGFTSLEIERTLGKPRSTVRYHVSTGMKQLRIEMTKDRWRFILTDFQLTDCNPMSA